MKIKIIYTMSAVIEAADLDKARNIWEGVELEKAIAFSDGATIQTEFREVTEAYDSDTWEDVKL